MLAALTVPVLLVGSTANANSPTLATTGASTTGTSTTGSARAVDAHRGDVHVGATSLVGKTTVEPTSTASPSSSSSTASDVVSPSSTGALATAPTRTRSTTIIRPPRTARSFCGGTLAFGTIKTCGLIIDEAKDVWNFTTTADSDTLYARFEQSGVNLDARVTDGAGTILCRLLSYLNVCQLGSAGTYTVTVSTGTGSGRGAYTLSVESRRTPSACQQLPADFFAWTSAGVTGTLPAGLATRCFAFDQPAGSVLQMMDPNSSDLSVRAEVVGSGHVPLCMLSYGGGRCTLSEAGPYRLFLDELSGREAPYTLRMPRLSQAVGCPTQPLAPFGDPGAAVGHASVAHDEMTCHSLTATDAGAVTVRLSHDIDWTLHDDAGQEICTTSSARYCVLPAAGPYTLLTTTRDYRTIDYQIAVTALHHNDGCAAAGITSWDQPTLRVGQASPVQTNCQPFQGRAGDRVIRYVSWNGYSPGVIDQSGVDICAEAPSAQAGCVLPADGTYRVISYLRDWAAYSTYDLQVRRLSEAVGCPAVAPGSYGTAPAAGRIRCRTLEIPTAGGYRLNTVTTDNYRVFHYVYDQDGRFVCAGGVGNVSGDCSFAAGRYTLVLQPFGLIDNDVPHAVALLPAAPSGCVAVSDTGWRDAPHQGSLQAAGQVNCLRLPSPTGSRILKSEPGPQDDEKHPEITLVDAAGAMVCDSSTSREYYCGLRGEGPFFALVKGQINTSASEYVMAFSRVDGPPACPVLPRDADTTVTTVTTGPERFVSCRSIPADQHATRESFSWARISGTGGAAKVTIYDSRGVEYCSPLRAAASGTITCTTLPAGPLTVMLETDGQNAKYRLTHQDASVPTT
ncbi:hypothetical protein GA0074695_0612 [Micromonospora viridifaciens]|uniref:Ig-like domain-containing protein n=1 Tax=Micromonospora viridifaciens TaxID=1881 RepID=A0A1C4UL94_MICVI|nr:hypothetical protein GA0074695_0612 [Micromonospora viridifaciens]